MKLIKYMMLFSVVFLFVQCNGKPDRPESILNETQKAYDGNDLNAPAAGTVTPPTAEPPQNAAGVWHYTCADGCAGGGGKAEPCAVCGKMLVHNGKYHEGQNNTPPAAQAGNTISFDPNNPTAGGNTLTLDPNTGQLNGNTNVAMPNSKPPEPPQNAAGVWHYTCPAGCAGGGGGATACAGCGATLAHNQAYHN